MSKRNSRRLPHDFHLWTSVAATVEPLRRKGLLKLGTTPLPLPEAEPEPTRSRAPSGPLKPGKPFLPPYRPPVSSAPPPDKAVDPAIHKKVRRGRIEIDGTIDLHGMTQVQAREALHGFVTAR